MLKKLVMPFLNEFYSSNNNFKNMDLSILLKQGRVVEDRSTDRNNLHTDRVWCSGTSCSLEFFEFTKALIINVKMSFS